MGDVFCYSFSGLEASSQATWTTPTRRETQSNSGPDFVRVYPSHQRCGGGCPGDASDLFLRSHSFAGVGFFFLLTRKNVFAILPFGQGWEAPAKKSSAQSTTWLGRCLTAGSELGLASDPDLGTSSPLSTDVPSRSCTGARSIGPLTSWSVGRLYFCGIIFV
jgi:hypothetical protein